MKKIASILLTTLISTSTFALPKKLPQAYEVICSINDDRDGDREISSHTFTLYKNEKSKAGWTEHFKVTGSDHDLVMQLYFYGDDQVFVLEVGDADAQIGAQTLHHNPQYLYVFLGTPDVGAFATCSFKPKKIKKTKS